MEMFSETKKVIPSHLKSKNFYSVTCWQPILSNWNWVRISCIPHQHCIRKNPYRKNYKERESIYQKLQAFNLGIFTHLKFRGHYLTIVTN